MNVPSAQFPLAIFLKTGSEVRFLGEQGVVSPISIDYAVLANPRVFPFLALLELFVMLIFASVEMLKNPPIDEAAKALNHVLSCIFRHVL